MSENLQKLLKEALLNNSYDYEAMDTSINKTWVNSYSYLYYLQKAKVEYEELFFYSSDDVSRNSKYIGHIHLDDLIRACFDVDYDLIHIIKRENFRLSEFYKTEINFEDVVYHPDIFLKIPIVIIDDKVIWDYKIKVTTDCTTFILPFKRSFVLKDERDPETDDVIYIDHKIQVLVVDNIFYQRYTFNKNTINLSIPHQTFRIHKLTMIRESENQIRSIVTSDFMKKNNIKFASQLTNRNLQVIEKEVKKRLKYVELPEKNGIMFATLHMPNRMGKGYELGTTLIQMIDDGHGYFVGTLTDDQLELIKNQVQNIFVSMIFINNLYEHIFYTGDKTITAHSDGNSDFIVLEEEKNIPYNAPIPIENFMVFRKNKETAGWYLEKNTYMLKMYYPNIYQLIDENMKKGDIYHIFYFYIPSPELKYTILFDFYFKFLLDIFPDYCMEQIISDIYYNRANLSYYDEETKKKFYDIFNKLMKYQYFHHQYGDIDFVNRYLPISENSDKEPIKYKDETLKQWIRIQPWVLRNYVLEQKKLGDSYHLFTNTLDLKSRIRINTFLELGEKDMYEFDEERYVFAFGNEREYPVLLDCRIFVDGLLVADVYHYRKLFMDYFYIPVKYVTDDSYIELEIFPRYQFEKEIEFHSLKDSETIKILEPTENIYPTTADLYFEMVDSKDMIDHVAPRFGLESFKLTSHYDRGNFEFSSDVPKKPVRFTRLSTFTIQPINEKVLNIPLKVRFSKIPITTSFVMDKPGFCYINIGSIDFQFSIDYVRVFRNGRLMPKNHYMMASNYGRPRLLIMEWCDTDDIIYIDVTPYRYTMLLHKEGISKKETLIDLRGVIDKPFDIRYYDVYLNGRKLSLNNVFTITPWEITLVNIKSNYNLDIYERERDWEYFGLDYTENIYYFNFDDLIGSGIVDDDEINKLIKDKIDKDKDPNLNIYPNEFIEDPIDYSDIDPRYPIFFIFYYDELIPKTFVNPDTCQFIDGVIYNLYPDIYEIYKKSPVDDSNYLQEKERRVDYPEVICLDPDIMVEARGMRPGWEVELKDPNDEDVYDEDNNLIVDIESLGNPLDAYEFIEDVFICNLDEITDADEEMAKIVDGCVIVYDVGHIGEDEDNEAVLVNTDIVITEDYPIDKKGDM